MLSTAARGRCQAVSALVGSLRIRCIQCGMYRRLQDSWFGPSQSGGQFKRQRTVATARFMSLLIRPKSMFLRSH
jgi:hypothetical protein